MKAIFYDRKNKCEVSSEDIFKIDMYESYAVVDDEGFKPGTSVKEITDKYGANCLSFSRRIVGEFGYKSKKCPESNNWDNWCNTSDLVFLRLE